MSLLEDVDVSDNFMVITVIVETGCVLRLLWMFSRVDRLLRLCQNLRQQLPQLTRMFGLCKFKACVQKDLTDEEKMVSEEVAHTQLRIARYFVRGYAIMFWLITITIQWKIVFDQPRWLPAMIPWATMISAAALTMGALFDSLLTTRTLNIWYCLCMLQTAAVTSPLAVPSYLLPIFWLMSFAFVRLPASMFIASSTPLAVVLNLCLSPLVWSRICLQRVELGDVDISILVFSFELIGCALAVAASPCAKSLLRTRVEQGVRCGKMETDLRAAFALLSLTCDAVLELDSEMRLASHSPELAACLLRNGQGTSLKGTRFTDFMPPSDAEQAAMMMQRASCSEPFRVHVFHTRMVDSCSSKFRTEVFQVSYTKWDGHLSHLIGLRDFTDQDALASPSLDSQPYNDGSAEDSFILPVQPSHRPSRTSQSHSFGALLPEVEDQLSWLEIDMSEMVVTAASVEVGFLAGRGLSEIVPANSMQGLEEMMQKAKESHMQGQICKMAFSFGNVEVSWTSGAISGRGEVMQTSDGLHFLIQFRLLRRSRRRRRRRPHRLAL